MIAETQSLDPQVAEGFTVHDAATANWLVRRIVESRAYARRVEQWAAAELRRAEREEDFFLRRFGLQLENWARRQIDEQDDGRKSVTLPAGVVGFRRKQARLAVTDETALLAWCRIHLPSAVKTVESVLKSTVMDHVKITGECPSGAEIAVLGDHLYIR